MAAIKQFFCVVLFEPMFLGRNYDSKLEITTSGSYSIRHNYLKHLAQAENSPSKVRGSPSFSMLNQTDFNILQVIIINIGEKAERSVSTIVTDIMAYYVQFGCKQPAFDTKNISKGLNKNPYRVILFYEWQNNGWIRDVDMPLNL